jgi:acetylornithine/succinyldiaminopimelate/putrescine aminotransferase
MRLARGEGVRLYDDAGRAYLDFASGIAVNALGYNDPGSRRVRGRCSTRARAREQPVPHRPGERLARRSWSARSRRARSSATRGGGQRGAFKFARRWARTLVPAGAARRRGRSAPCAKHEIVALRGAFHGRTMGALAATTAPPTARRSSRSRRRLIASATSRSWTRRSTPTAWRR